MAVGIAHEVGARDVAPHAARRLQADALLAEAFGGSHNVLGDHAIAHDFLVVVQIVDQHVQRGDPLLEPALERLPFIAADDPRDDVERNDPLEPAAIAVDVERNSELHHRPVGRVLSAGEVFRQHAADALAERLAIGRGQPFVVEHFIVEAVRRVLGQRNR